MKWTDDVDGEVQCPHCHEFFGDLWDFEWKNEIVETECPCCGGDIVLRAESPHPRGEGQIGVA